MKLSIFLSVYICVSLIFAQNEIGQSIDLSAEIFEPKHYIIAKTYQELTIDGRANEPQWLNAAFTDLFIDIEGVKRPKFDTKLKMLWDNSYLYVFAILYEPHIWGDITERDAVIFYNNDFEVFISPSNSTINYGEIEINALGTVWDLFLNKAYRVGGRANDHWNLTELKSAIHVEGSLNDPSDIDSYWTVEMAIPMKALLEIKRQGKDLPLEGEQWRINFSRVQWDHDIIDGVYRRKKENGKYLKEYNWVWSNQKTINMHQPEHWGFLQFTHSTTAENVQFRHDEDILFKQLAYALFRHTRHSSLKYLLQKKAGYSEKRDVKYSDEKSLEVMFYKTHFGFEYVVTSPITKTSYVVNEDGELKSLK